MFRRLIYIIMILLITCTNGVAYYHLNSCDQQCCGSECCCCLSVEENSCEQTPDGCSIEIIIVLPTVSILSTNNSTYQLSQTLTTEPDIDYCTAVPYSTFIKNVYNPPPNIQINSPLRI